MNRFFVKSVAQPEALAESTDAATDAVAKTLTH
jgi:hypothetical protein